MTSALALSAALAFGALPATAALAGPDVGNSNVQHSNLQDNSANLAVGITDSLNDNSTNDSNNDNSTDLDLGVSDSFNDSSNSNNDNSADLDVGVTDSFNDNSQTDSNNDNSTNLSVADSGNDNSQHDSNNDNSSNLDVAVTDSFKDSSIHDSYNDNSDNSTTNIRVSLSMQELSANVSGFEFDVGGGHHDGKLRTGDISNSGGAFAGFAGIQTANYNTGFAANNQAATAISANANVTFGNGGG